MAVCQPSIIVVILRSVKPTQKVEVQHLGQLKSQVTTCLADKTNHPVKRLSLNRSQCGSCSTKYDTSAGTKVVYNRFGASTLLSGLTGRTSTLVAQVQIPIAGLEQRAAILPRTKRRPNSKVAMSRRASALEAFRHNPTDGSFAPSAYRPSTCTKCPKLRFLSY